MRVNSELIPQLMRLVRVRWSSVPSNRSTGGVPVMNSGLVDPDAVAWFALVLLSDQVDTGSLLFSVRSLDLAQTWSVGYVAGVSLGPDDAETLARNATFRTVVANPRGALRMSSALSSRRIMV